MNKFFKVSLVAAAIAVTGTASAGTFTGNDTVAADVTANENAVVFSTQGFAKLAGTELQAAPTISYTLGAAYIVGDELIFAFNNALDAKTVLPTNIMVDTADFSLISSTATEVQYRVVAGAAKVGSKFVLPQEKATTADLSDAAKSGLVMTATLLSTATVTPIATKNYGAAPHDRYVPGAAGKDNVLALSTTQFGTAKIAASFNAVIDGSTAGNDKRFIGATADSVTYAYTAPKTMPTTALLGADDGINDLTAAATQVAQTAVITTSTNLTAGYDVTSSVAGATVDVIAANIIVTYPKGAEIVGDTVTVTPKTGASAPTIAAKTFALALNEVTSSTVVHAAVAGAWAVEGAVTVNVPYMPYGTGLSQVIYAQNTSASDVEVSAKATDEAGTVYDLGVVATAKASSVTKLATGIKNALTADGFVKGKVSLEITFRGNGTDVVAASSTYDNAAAGVAPIVNVASAIKLHSGYNANGTDRGFVANSTNGAK